MRDTNGTQMTEMKTKAPPSYPPLRKIGAAADVAIGVSRDAIYGVSTRIFSEGDVPMARLYMWVIVRDAMRLRLYTWNNRLHILCTF